MLEACRQNRVQFMDGVMFRHGERLSRIRSVLDDSNSVGSLRRVTSAFSFRGSEEFFAELIFDDDFSASFFCSFLVESQQWAHLSGTRGALRIDDFVLPYERAETQFKILRERFDVRGCEFRMQPDEQTVTVAEHGHSHATAQETRLFQNFAAAVQSGKFNDAWPEIALQSQQVIDACIRSASLGQPCSVAS